METKAICPQCGTELGPRQVSGLCPKCLMEGGLQSLGNSTLPVDVDPARSSFEPPTAPDCRYTLIGEHARGGMGRVLVMHDEALGRDVAMKELLPAGESPDDETSTPTPVRHSKDLATRFLREAKITGQLEHPGIVPVHELGWRPDGSLYYTMKLVQGRTLQDCIRQSRSYADRVRLLSHFVDLCQAMSYAHSRGVIHRDLKPSNVMIGDYGETIVLDWGLAKVNGSEDEVATEPEIDSSPPSVPDSGSTEYGAVMGTPVYMSPEQARGQLDRIDERSDVYALGAVLYEILTGQAPFGGTSSEAIVHQVIHDQPVPIREIEPRASQDLVRICERAMAKGRSERIASASMLAREVEYASRTPDVFFNVLRPYLTDLVPELAGLPYSVQSFVRAEASTRWRVKNLWRSLFQDAAIIAVMTFYFGYIFILAALGLVADPWTAIQGAGGYWSLVPAGVVLVAAGILTHKLHNRSIRPYIREVLVEREILERLRGLPETTWENRIARLGVKWGLAIMGGVVSYTLFTTVWAHSTSPPVFVAVLAGAGPAFALGHVGFELKSRRKVAALLESQASAT